MFVQSGKDATQRQLPFFTAGAFHRHRPPIFPTLVS
jgi:hypothetical protein